MITLSFASPTTRERVLFFRDRQGLLDFMNSDTAAADESKLLQEIASKHTLGPTHAVIAVEPDKYVDLQKSFYLLPVLEASSTLLKSGYKARVVKVASVTRDGPSLHRRRAVRVGGGRCRHRQLQHRGGVRHRCHLVDAAVHRSHAPGDGRGAEAGRGGAKVDRRIRFGIVAFQDDPAKAKGCST